MPEKKKLKIKYKIWIETEDSKGVFGDGKWRLLKSIHETGSLKEAMNKHNLSYRKTWDNLNKIEETLGFEIINKQRGGKTGGTTTLTPAGEAIVKAFDKFHSKYDTIISDALEDTLMEIHKSIIIK
jgi:molybdate transport system regulatory protein